MYCRSQDMVFIYNVEEVAHRFGHSSKPSNSLIFIAYALFPTGYKFVAEITKHSPALLKHKVHNLSLTSDSRQDLQLDPKSIPSIHVETRFSYPFSLPVNHTIS